MEAEIQRLMKEGDLYHSQGLFNEAMAVYETLQSTLRNSRGLPRRDEHLARVSEKIQAVQSDREETEELTRSPRVSSKAQNVIKRLFSSRHKEKDLEALDEAVTLVDFGQYERALSELQPLLERKRVRLQAAESILRCQMAMGEVDAVLNRFRQWQTGERFPADDIERIRSYLDTLLQEAGLGNSLQEVTAARTARRTYEGNGDLLEFQFIEIAFEDGPLRGKRVDLPVQEQDGNQIRILISEEQGLLLEQMEPGRLLGHVRYFAPPHALMNASAEVVEKRKRSASAQDGFVVNLRIRAA